MFGKGPFGGGMNINAEIVNGICPSCANPTVFVSLYETLFKCTSCGSQLEQKINGVISYIPTSYSGDDVPTLKTTHNGSS